MPRQAGQGLQGHRAGFVSRMVADVVDGIVLVAIGFATLLSVALIVFLIRPRSFAIPDVPLSALLPVAAVLVLGYFGYGWSGPGRTVGKELTGLRVVDTSGRLLSVRRALLRAAFYVVFPAGLLWSVLSRRSASVQDLVVRTAVVYDWSRGHADTWAPAPEGQPAGAPQHHGTPSSVQARADS